MHLYFGVGISFETKGKQRNLIYILKVKCFKKLKVSATYFYLNITFIIYIIERNRFIIPI